MSKVKIYGNPNPVIGIKEYYSIHDFFGSSAPSKFIEPLENIPDENIKWSVWILLGNEWTKMTKNNKTGATVEYTFTQTSLKRKGIRMLVDANGEKAVLDIKTKSNAESKILHVEILDNLGKKPTELFSYGETITARVHCLNMEKFRINVTLWENDGGKKDLSDISIETKEANVLNGIADVKFTFDPSKVWLANAKTAPNESNEGAFHEYYVTAEFYKKVSKPTQDINVINPDYKVDILSKTSASKPSETETQKTSPAEQKGPSKKETRGIAKADRKAHDYQEQKIEVKKEIWKNPFIEKLNSYFTVDVGDAAWNPKKGTCVCKDYDLVWGGHPNINCDFKRKVIEISKRQNFDPNHLMAVMWVETNKTFSNSLIKLLPNGKFRSDGTPKKENRGLNENEIKALPQDFVGAVGLIQFTPVAIDELNNYYGYSLTKRKLALMTQLTQLDYVEKYIEFWVKSNKIKSKLTLADLYLLIFSPSKMNGSNDSTTLYKEGTTYYNANKSIDTDKKNGITKKELAHRAYESFEEGNKKENKSSIFTCGLSDEKKIPDIPTDGVLEEMKTIADSHRPYLQETNKNRTADTEAGLAKMDCSEFVSRYLHKLGITKNIIYMTTANMVSENAFRKIIENDNIDLVRGSLLSDFKPKKGDIFAWGYTKDGSWAGHTGIVYDYDEIDDIVTILEAVGSHGAVSENDQVKNGGYSGKGCTRTAKYGRLKGALYGHTGWHGYFRPKNFTKTL
jgi:hypothetical protein